MNSLLLLVIFVIFSCFAQQGTTPEDIKIQNSILIKDGTVVNAHIQQVVDVLIENGKIKQVGKNIQAPVGAKVIDASGKLIMPGGIDTHVHMELPFMGTVSADDFYTGTASGLAGGTTLLMDFCIAFPGTRLTEAYEQHLVKSAKSSGDYSFHMGKKKKILKKRNL
jgi:dihydropyrimidinase